MKALEKDRNQRYASAIALENDIHHFINFEPVEAGPPSISYKMRKLARKHRGKVLVAAVICFLLIAGVIGTTAGWLQAVAAKKEAFQSETLAKNEAATYRALVDYLDQELFTFVDPEERAKVSLTMIKDIPLRAVLDHSQQHLGDRFPDKPQVSAALYLTIGKAYSSLGIYDKARSNLEKSYQLCKMAYSDSDSHTLDAAEALGGVLYDLGKYEDARNLYKQALAHRSAQLGLTAPATMKCRYTLASIDRSEDKTSEAEQQLKQLLEDQQNVLTSKHPDTIRTMRALADVYRRQQKNQEAETLLETTLENCRSAFQPDHPSLMATINNLAQLCRFTGKLPRAQQLYAELVPSASRVFGPEDPTLLLYLNNQAVCFFATDQLDLAEPIFPRVLSVYEKVLPPDHINVLVVKFNIAMIYQRKSKYKEAIVLYEAILPEFKKLNVANTWGVMEQLTRCYGAVGEQQKVIATADELLSYLGSQKQLDERRYAGIVLSLSEACAKTQDLVRAQKVLQDGLAKCKRACGSWMVHLSSEGPA